MSESLISVRDIPRVVHWVLMKGFDNCVHIFVPLYSLHYNVLHSNIVCMFINRNQKNYLQISLLWDYPWLPMPCWQKYFWVLHSIGIHNHILSLFFQILWKIRCNIVVSFPSHMKKIIFYTEILTGKIQ